MRTLTFSAVVLDTGELLLEPGFVVDGEPSQTDGEVVVEALGRGGDVLATTQVPLGEPCGAPRDGPVGERPPQVAVGLVAFPDDAVGLRVTIDGRTALERSAPRRIRPPAVTWPRDLNSGTASVEWRTTSDQAMASLGYSSDDGKHWAPLSLPTSNAAIEFDTTTLAGGPRCLLELAVTDGFRTIHVRSDPYSVEPKGWLLWILSPASGAVVDRDDPVLLAAQGYHVEERRPSFDEITWSSSIDGQVGHGAQVAVTLSPGDHTITAAANGVSAEVVVSVASGGDR